MQQYIGTKILRNVIAMTLGEYNSYRDWPMPEDEDPTAPGFLVEYQDGGKANDARHEGYISWSPENAFHSAYRKTDGMTFGLATEAAKIGHKIARKGWNGSGMFAYIVPQVTGEPANMPYPSVHDAGTVITYRAYWQLKTADGSIASWAPSGSDSLAEDWVIVE